MNDKVVIILTLKLEKASSSTSTGLRRRATYATAYTCIGPPNLGPANLMMPSKIIFNRCRLGIVIHFLTSGFVQFVLLISSMGLDSTRGGSPIVMNVAR